MKIEGKIRIEGIFEATLDKKQFDELLKFIKSTDARLKPIFDEDYNPIGGRKIKEFIEQMPMLSDRKYIETTLKRSEMREVQVLKVVPGLEGGLKDWIHTHIEDEVYVFDQAQFNKLLLSAKVDMHKMETAHTVSK